MTNGYEESNSINSVSTCPGKRDPNAARYDAVVDDSMLPVFVVVAGLEVLLVNADLAVIQTPIMIMAAPRYPWIPNFSPRIR
jgi:hypothetical protein